MLTASAPAFAIFPCLTAISSATMLTAISCGVMAPMSRPIGACTFASRSAGRPSSLQRVEDPPHLGLAADEAEVPERRRREGAQRVEVVPVSRG